IPRGSGSSRRTAVVRMCSATTRPSRPMASAPLQRARRWSSTWRKVRRGCRRRTSASSRKNGSRRAVWGPVLKGTGPRCFLARSPPRLRQGGYGRRIGEAARQQVEGKQLEEDRQQQHSSGRGEDGERRDRLGQIDELLADLRPLLPGQRSSGGGLGQQLAQLARLADLLEEPIEVVQHGRFEPGGERVRQTLRRFREPQRGQRVLVLAVEIGDLGL